MLILISDALVWYTGSLSAPVLTLWNGSDSNLTWLIYIKYSFLVRVVTNMWRWHVMSLLKQVLFMNFISTNYQSLISLREKIGDQCNTNCNIWWYGNSKRQRVSNVTSCSAHWCTGQAFLQYSCTKNFFYKVAQLCIFKIHVVKNLDPPMSRPAVWTLLTAWKKTEFKGTSKSTGGIISLISE